MNKSYPEITKRISGNIREFRKDMSDVMSNFSDMAKSATKDGALTKKTKELIALAIGISRGCDGCIGFHVKALVDLGATKEEIQEVLEMAIYMGGGPSLMYASDAMLAYEQFSNIKNSENR
ncbi:MAG: carboxymuconolactone decarboxylase family protein [Proteobacteria bacterium]|nr:carboxymuconolactone decarboxylase family protein [Pseudomonadota bacterium]